MGVCQEIGTELPPQLQPNSLQVRQAKITTLQITRLEEFSKTKLTRLVLNIVNELLANLKSHGNLHSAQNAFTAKIDFPEEMPSKFTSWDGRLREYSGVDFKNAKNDKPYKQRI